MDRESLRNLVYFAAKCCEGIKLSQTHCPCSESSWVVRPPAPDTSASWRSFGEEKWLNVYVWLLLKNMSCNFMSWYDMSWHKVHIWIFSWSLHEKIHKWLITLVYWYLVSYEYMCPCTSSNIGQISYILCQLLVCWGKFKLSNYPNANYLRISIWTWFMSDHVETTLCHDITTYNILWQPYWKQTWQTCTIQAIWSSCRKWETLSRVAGNLVWCTMWRDANTEIAHTTNLSGLRKLCVLLDNNSLNKLAIQTESE